MCTMSLNLSFKPRLTLPSKPLFHVCSASPVSAGGTLALYTWPIDPKNLSRIGDLAVGSFPNLYQSASLYARSKGIPISNALNPLCIPFTQPYEMYPQINVTVSAGDTLAPQNSTNVINVNDVANGTTNITRSSAPPLYAMLSHKSSLGALSNPARSAFDIAANGPMLCVPLGDRALIASATRARVDV